MRRLSRDRWDKKIAGVCGGFGRFFKIDPNVIRIILVFVSILTWGIPAIFYAIACLLPPGPSKYIQFPCRHLYRSTKNRMLSGICGGIADFTKIDAKIIRITLVVLLFCTGILPLSITYFAGSLIIPQKPN